MLFNAIMVYFKQFCAPRAPLPIHIFLLLFSIIVLLLIRLFPSSSLSYWLHPAYMGFLSESQNSIPSTGPSANLLLLRLLRQQTRNQIRQRTVGDATLCTVDSKGGDRMGLFAVR